MGEIFHLWAQINRKIDFTIESFLGGILRWHFTMIVKYPKKPDFFSLLHHSNVIFSTENNSDGLMIKSPHTELKKKSEF